MRLHLHLSACFVGGQAVARRLYTGIDKNTPNHHLSCDGITKVYRMSLDVHLMRSFVSIWNGHVRCESSLVEIGEFDDVPFWLRVVFHKQLVSWV